MRVTVVGAQLCASVPGGTGRYTAELVRSLQTTAGRGDTVDVTVPRGCHQADDLGVPVHRLAVPLAAISRLWERGLPPRLHGQEVTHAPTLLVPPARGGALVVTVHDAVPWTHPETLTRRGVAFHRRMGARAAHLANLIVSPSEATAEAVRRHLSPRCPVVVVYPGVSSLSFHGDPAIGRGISTNRPFVLFVGTAEPRKGLDLLVKAMGTTAMRGMDLIVAGPLGWGDVSVIEMARREGIAHRVQITGRVSDATLRQLYESARVVAVPSLAEGFGLPVVESMSLGTPVVISDDDALVEVAGGAAVSVEGRNKHSWADALAQVAEDGPARDQLVLSGRMRSADFNWQASAAKLWTHYRTLSSHL